MKLTKNFTLDEMCVTNTGLYNAPDMVVLGKLMELCKNVLQPLRDKYGKAITVNSGYRSIDVNAKVGGATNSQHLRGEAVDITAGNKAENRKLFAILEGMDYDQLIDEKDMRWIHVSYKKAGNRKQKLKL